MLFLTPTWSVMLPTPAHFLHQIEQLQRSPARMLFTPLPLRYQASRQPRYRTNTATTFDCEWDQYLVSYAAQVSYLRGQKSCLRNSGKSPLLNQREQFQRRSLRLLLTSLPQRNDRRGKSQITREYSLAHVFPFANRRYLARLLAPRFPACSWQIRKRRRLSPEP